MRQATHLPTILLIDHDEYLRQNLSSVLERRGLKVLQANDSVEASEIWRRDEFSIDVLIANLVSPNFTGSELAIQFRKSRPGLKVIFTSRNDEKVHLETTRLVKGARVLRHPFNQRALLEVVRTELADQWPAQHEKISHASNIFPDS